MRLRRAVTVAMIASAAAFATPAAAHEVGDGAYRWVRPPRDAPEAPEPADASMEFPLPEEAGGGTGDRQFLFRLPAGAVPARSGSGGFIVSIRPLDANDVARFPSGLMAASNAYEVDIQYRPGGDDVGTLALEGGFSMATGLDATELLRKEGDRWTKVADARPDPANHRMGGFFAGSVTLVAAAPGSAPSSGGTPLIAVAAITAVALAAVALIALSGRATRARRESGG